MDGTLTPEQLTDRQAIVGVIDRYATSLDAKDYDRFLTCFSEDAVVHYGEALGREEAAAYAAQVLSQYAHTQHLLGNYEIALDGDRASSKTYLHASHVTAEGEIWVLGGTYLDRLERRAGEWKIVERSLEAKWSERRTIASA